MHFNYYFRISNPVLKHWKLTEKLRKTDKKWRKKYKCNCMNNIKIIIFA